MVKVYEKPEDGAVSQCTFVLLLSVYELFKKRLQKVNWKPAHLCKVLYPAQVVMKIDVS